MTADTFDPEIRSWIMSRVQSRDTKPEQIVCGALRDAHIRFSTNGKAYQEIRILFFAEFI